MVGSYDKFEADVVQLKNRLEFRQGLAWCIMPDLYVQCKARLIQGLGIAVLNYHSGYV